MNLYIKNTNNGRGVFCDDFIPKGTIIEICPVIVCPESDRQYIDKTFLYNYYFLWHEDHKSTAIALGFGSIYNHSYTPNCRYECFYEDEIIQFIAILDIAKDTELTINYNYDVDSKQKLWFDVK
jgi:SET domain-containing protein